MEVFALQSAPYLHAHRSMVDISTSRYWRVRSRNGHRAPPISESLEGGPPRVHKACCAMGVIPPRGMGTIWRLHPSYLSVSLYLNYIYYLHLFEFCYLCAHILHFYCVFNCILRATACTKTNFLYFMYLANKSILI